MFNILTQSGDMPNTGSTINGYFAIPVLNSLIYLFIIMVVSYFTLKSHIRIRFKILILILTLIIAATMIALNFVLYFSVI